MNVEGEKINEAKALKLHAWHFLKKKEREKSTSHNKNSGCCRSCKEFAEIYHSVWYWMTMEWETVLSTNYIHVHY